MKLLKRVGAALLALGAGGATAQAPVAQTAAPVPVVETSAPAPVVAQAPAAMVAAKPALWKLADADTTIYLFGTIHALPPETRWQTAALDEALGRSEELVLEAVLGDDPMALAKVMMAKGVRPGLPPLSARVPADKQAALATAMAASGIPAETLDRFETWAAALTLISLQVRQLGIDPASGVEHGLAAAAAKASRKVAGLETVDQQMGFFDELSEEAQRALLVSALDDPANAKAEFTAMLAAWQAGDVDGIARTFDAETNMSAELKEVLMTRRNAAWATWLKTRLDTPGTVTVAVGAGHLAGADSVLSRLNADGLTVERVQ